MELGGKLRQLREKTQKLNLLTSLKISKAFEAFSNQLEPWSVVHFFKCMEYQCDFTTNDKNEFVQHVGSLHNSESISCLYCSNVSAKVEDVAQHMVEVHGGRKFQCALCYYRSYAKTHMSIHTYTVHSSNKVLAYECLPLPDFQEKEAIHVVQMFRCSVKHCIFETINPDRFKDHLNDSHSNIEYFKCNLCIRGNMNSENLPAHYRREHKFRTFLCCYCTFESDDQWLILEHMTSKHSDHPFRFLLRNKQQFPCFDFKKSEVNSESPKGSDRLYDTNGGIHQDYVCNVSFCSDTFDNASYYAEHLFESHFDEVVFRCPKCEHSVERVMDIFIHIIEDHEKGLLACLNDNCFFVSDSHEAVKEHRASCNPVQNNNSKQQMDDDDLTEDDEGPARYCCAVKDCKREIRNVSAYGYHLRAFHKDEIEYWCPECFDVMPSIRMLFSHMLTHQEDTMYPCSNEWCFFTSISQAMLNSHIKTCSRSRRQNKTRRSPTKFINLKNSTDDGSKESTTASTNVCETAQTNVTIKQEFKSPVKGNTVEDNAKGECFTTGVNDSSFKDVTLKTSTLKNVDNVDHNIMPVLPVSQTDEPVQNIGSIESKQKIKNCTVETQDNNENCTNSDILSTSTVAESNEQSSARSTPLSEDYCQTSNAPYSKAAIDIDLSCAHCGVTFTCELEWFRHFALGHGYKYFCGYCSRPYKNLHYFSKHLQVSHPGLTIKAKSFQENTVIDVDLTDHIKVSEANPKTGPKSKAKKSIKRGKKGKTSAQKNKLIKNTIQITNTSVNSGTEIPDNPEVNQVTKTKQSSDNVHKSSEIFNPESENAILIESNSGSDDENVHEKESDDYKDYIDIPDSDKLFVINKDGIKFLLYDIFKLHNFFPDVMVEPLTLV